MCTYLCTQLYLYRHRCIECRDQNDEYVSRPEHNHTRLRHTVQSNVNVALVFINRRPVRNVIRLTRDFSHRMTLALDTSTSLTNVKTRSPLIAGKKNRCTDTLFKCAIQRLSACPRQRMASAKLSMQYYSDH